MVKKKKKITLSAHYLQVFPTMQKDSTNDFHSFCFLILTLGKCLTLEEIRQENEQTYQQVSSCVNVAVWAFSNQHNQHRA